jgi:hypothetical protein
LNTGSSLKKMPGLMVKVQRLKSALTSGMAQVPGTTLAGRAR